MSTRIFVGTKAFALRGTLLDRDTVRKLAECTSLDELINRLRGTPYSEVLSGLTQPFSARRLELAFRERFAEVGHSIVSTAGQYGILELYYLKQIAWDLKTVLKAKALDRTYEGTLEYIDMKAEELVGRRDLIVRVLSAKDVNEAVALLSGTEFFDDAQKALSSFSSRGEVRFFDLYLDHAVLTAISKEYANKPSVYSSTRATDVGGIRDIVTNDVDAYNVLSLLRSKLWGLSEQEVRSLMISPTYRVSSALLTKMAGAESTTEAVKLLESVYPLQPQTAAGDEEQIDAVEDKFTLTMRQSATKAFVWQGLGPGVALALMKLLEFEVGNLAAIAIGVEAGMDPKRILSKLRV